MCGASSGQKAIGQQQSNFFTTAQNTAQQILGAGSSVFKNLMATFQPIVAAGPNQKGFSLGEESNLKSQAITQTGAAYKNASQAVREQTAAQGGGNVVLPGGAAIGRNIDIANAGAQQTASELGQINEANYATGRENYKEAVAGEAGAPGVFNPAVSAENAATGSGQAASQTENEISSQNQSWMQAVSGALGGVAGAVGSYEGAKKS